MARRRGTLKRLGMAVAIGAVAAIIGGMIVEAARWPDGASLSSRNPSTTAFIEADRSNGVDVQWRQVPYDEISTELAVVVAEDISFFGINPWKLDTHQAAQLAASLSRPSLWHPGSTARGYNRHVERIRTRMSNASWMEKHLRPGTR